MQSDMILQDESSLVQTTPQNGAGEENLLHEFNKLLGESIITSEARRFKLLVHYLMNDLCLVAGQKRYRVVECEVYYYDENNAHADKNTHQRDEQLKSGTWYFNDFGLDITIGDSQKKVYGGILIRSLRCLTGEVRYINGPSCILRELFSQLGSVFNTGNSFYFEKDSEGLIQDREIYRTTRVNLAKDDQDFKEKDYRFVCELNRENKIPGKEALVRQLYKNNKITTEKVVSILGYNLKS